MKEYTFFTLEWCYNVTLFVGHTKNQLAFNIMLDRGVRLVQHPFLNVRRKYNDCL